MKSTLRLIVTATIAFSFSCLTAFSQQVAKTIPNSTAPEGLIGFLQFTPSDYGSQKHPLIIFLHGIGERGNGTSQINSVTANAIPKFCAAGASMRFTVNGQTSSFVVLSPQLSNGYGYWPTFYVKEMIKYAKANLQIDPNRIYITGLSLGGGGIWRALTEVTDSYYGFPGEIAAAAPVCGTQEEIDANMCSTVVANHLPIWNFHSMDDGTVNVGASQHAEILLSWCSNVSPAPKFTYYQYGGHAGAWVNAYDTGHITTPVVVNGSNTSFTANPNMYEWFLSNSRNSSTPTYTAPVASAGSAQTITLPTSSLTLSGSGTGTNGASISSYSWVKTSGPSSGSINSSNSASTSVSGLTQGTYVFTLTVTDNHGLTSSSSVTITVNAAYTAPVANAGSAQTITLPVNSITLSGSGTGTNGASISSYSWAQTSGPAASVISLPLINTTLVTGLVQGTYVFTLTVTDNHGLTNSSSVSTTVNGAATSSATPAEQPIGYVKLASGSYQACADGSTSGRTPVYASGVGNGSILYTDAAHTRVFNGGWNWYSYATAASGPVTMAFAVYPNGSVNMVSYCNAGLPTSTPPTTTSPPAATPTTGTLLGYIKQSSGYYQACGDASSSNRMAIYGNSLANGGILYTDAALTQKYNGGWNWYSITPTVGGVVTSAFAIFPDGSINMLNSCAGGTTTTTPTTPPPTTATPIGYIKMSSGPYQACGDASSDGRTAVYGTSIDNGVILYTDAAKTKPYNGGWNWFSITSTLGGGVSQTFAIYPNGGILLLRSCSNPGGRTAASNMPATTVEEDMATLKQLKDAAEATTTNTIPGGKMVAIYPNPVTSNATIQFYSASNGLKTISVYDAKGVLHAKYTVPAIQGNNTMALKNAAALDGGLYIVDVRDNNGKADGTVKFIKIK